MKRFGRTLVLAALVVVLSAAAAASTAQRAHAWPIGTQGCTLGYWKNHTNAWVTYSPTDTIGATFHLTTVQTPYASNTLLEGLGFQGGSGLLGGERILLKQAIAGLLNSSAGLDYGAGTTEIIGITHNAILSGNRDLMITRAGQFDTRNNVGCPLS
ncbi:MAG TPA: hypothetical protein VGC71_02335 [Gaiellales bacterium]